MSLFASILLNNIVPIFLAIGAGYTLARSTAIEAASLSRVVLNIFAPCLVYSLLTEVEIQSSEVVGIVLLAVFSHLINGGLAWLFGSFFGIGRKPTAALMLVAMVSNNGNYGLSLSRLAFGGDAMARAVIFFVTSSVMTFTVGTYLASSGKLTAGDALKAVFRLPPIYAVLLALVSVATGLRLPEPVLTTIELLGEAAIPVMLVILGIQIASVSGLERIRLVGLASALRLIGGPLVALALVGVLRLQGPARQASVVQASMPTGVVTIVLATEFDLEPAFVTSAVIVSTIMSPITLTLLIALLG